MNKAARVRQRFQRVLQRDLWTTVIPAVALVIAAFAVTLYFVKPAPPKKIVIATPEDEGGARFFARRYRELLARDGITLEVRAVKGSVASLALLNDPSAGVDVAFVQGGIAGKDVPADLYSLGSLSYTPLWVFYRGTRIDDLRALAGKRLAVGTQETGTAALAITLLRASGVDLAAGQLLNLGREEAVDQFKKGKLDAIFLVSPADAPAIKRLAGAPDVQLMSFSRADAYVRRFPYLSKLQLPRGVFDLKSDVPSEDIVLVSPTANLIARDSLHPALSYLLMRVASEVHGGSGILDRSGEFPAPLENGFPLSSEARRYYSAGVPLLQRYLPFWAANLVDRLWLMLVPLLAVAIPLGRTVPALYRWRVRSRIFRWYARLKQIEIQLDESPQAPELIEMLKRLEEIERSVNQISTPLAFTENLYFFREHVDIVRRRLLRRLDTRPDGDAQSAR